jgi:dTDP-4-amino-4,6-dideoxygalactose transaminase
MPEAVRPPYGWARLSAVDAALLGVQFDKAADIVSRRRANARSVRSALRQYPGLFRLQNDRDHAYTKLSVQLVTRELAQRFNDFMWSHHVELEQLYIPLHGRDFAGSFAAKALPTTEQLTGTVYSIPVRPNLTTHQVRRIADLIGEFGRMESC